MPGPFYLVDGGPSSSPTWHTDGSPGITTATLLLFAVDGFVTGIRYYAGDTTQVTLALWRGSTDGPVAAGTPLREVVHTPSGVGWQVVPVEPVQVRAGVPYVASRWHPFGYGFVGGFFNTSHGQLTTEDPVYGPATSEDISALLDPEYQAGWSTAAVNGRFGISASPGWAGSSASAAYYGVDAEFRTELTTEITGTLTGTLPVIAGQLVGYTIVAGILGGVLPGPAGQIVGHPGAVGVLGGTLPVMVGTLRQSAAVVPGVLTPSGHSPSTLTPAAVTATLIPSGSP